MQKYNFHPEPPVIGARGTHHPQAATTDEGARSAENPPRLGPENGIWSVKNADDSHVESKMMVKHEAVG